MPNAVAKDPPTKKSALKKLTSLALRKLGTTDPILGEALRAQIDAQIAILKNEHGTELVEITAALDAALRKHKLQKRRTTR